jgi:hypothetical protein
LRVFTSISIQSLTYKQDYCKPPTNPLYIILLVLHPFLKAKMAHLPTSSQPAVWISQSEQIEKIHLCTDHEELTSSETSQEESQYTTSLAPPIFQAMASVAPSSPFDKVPDEILAAILTPYLVVNKTYGLALRNANAMYVSRDVCTISALGVEGLSYRSLANLFWFKEAVWLKDYILNPNQMTAHLNPMPLEVSKRFASVGAHLLRRSSGFFEVATPITTFEEDAEEFGLKIWELDDISHGPDAAVKVFMKPNCNIVGPQTLEDQQSTRRYLLDINDMEEFGRFLMMQGAQDLPDYTGFFLRILVARETVPGFCAAGETFEKMLLGPFLTGLSRSISNIEFTEDVKNQLQLRERLEHHRKLIGRAGGHAQVDFFGPSAFLDYLMGQYEDVMNKNEQKSDDLLRRIIQFAVTALRSKLDAFGTIDGVIASNLLPVRFILEVLRVAAFHMAHRQLSHFRSAFHTRRPYRSYAEHALHCFGYTLACLPLKLSSRHLLGWKATCYGEMFMVHLMLGQATEARKCVEAIGQLGIMPDPNKSQEQVDALARLTRARWGNLLIMAKEAYIAGGCDGKTKWKSLSFRVAFGLKFGREVLEPWHREKWPMVGSVGFPKLVRFVPDLRTD